MDDFNDVIATFLCLDQGSTLALGLCSEDEQRFEVDE